MTVPLPDLGPSLAHMLGWWLTLVVLTTLGWRLLRAATSGWHDHGWVIARPLAVLAGAFAVFVAAHVLPIFRADMLWVATAVVAVVVVWRTRRGGNASHAFSWRALLAAEARFVLPFLFYLLMRGFNHDIIGLEKFMDLGFVNAAMRVHELPVPDLWFAGEPINYYYFGHFVTAFLCKLSATPTAYGFNLMLATIFASIFQLAYAFVAEMGRTFTPSLRSAMGYLAGTWLCVGGNIHGFLYGFIRPWLVDFGFRVKPQHAFLMSDSTRFVGWNPPTDDKLIHEFPAYAFYVGDLHAHLLNLPWVLLFCCVMLNWLRARHAGGRHARAWLATAAWLTGIFAMSNSWDALMYAALLGCLLIFLAGQAWRTGRVALRSAILDGVLAALVAMITFAPFALNFHPHSEGFLRTHSHTPLFQWLILYGLQVALALAGCTVALWHRNAPIARPERLLLVGMTVSAIVFALFPEVYYLKDIYGSAHYRGNTAFKFGFQAFTLSTLAACIGVGLLLSVRGRRLPRLLVALLLEVVLVPPLFYTWFALQGGLGVWRDREWTLNGHRYLALTYPDDLALTQWLLHQPETALPGRLIEASDLSYTYGARISANTGIPAVLGWPVHEQLWRGSDPAVWKRRDDINAFYEARKRDDAEVILARYRPRWIIVGGHERKRYKVLDAALLASLGTVVFRSGQSFIVEVPPGTP